MDFISGEIMKTKILIACLGLTAAIAASSCSSPSPNQTTNGSVSNGNTTATHRDHQNMDHEAGMNHSEMQNSPDVANAPFDLQFLDTMIAHHQGAVEMAKPAQAKAQRAEVKTLAKNIIADQEKEIAQMRRWREEWFSGKPAVNMEMAGMKDSMKGMDMKKLESSAGNDFDLEFVTQMIPHHEGAIVIAKEALQKSQKDEIKTLANAIIKAQEAEIKQMKDWLAAGSK